MARDRVTWYITGFAYLALLALGVQYLIQRRWELLYFDVVIGMLAIGLFLLLFDRTRQDNTSFGAFVLVIILHSMFFYESAPLGFAWDHYMHFIGGAAIALIADRMFFEVQGRTKRTVLLILVALGVGGIHEIIEWLGYAYLGEGEGFLLFGAGDIGEWRNTVLDLAFDALGGLATAGSTWFSKRHGRNSAGAA